MFRLGLAVFLRLLVGDTGGAAVPPMRGADIVGNAQGADEAPVYRLKPDRKTLSYAYDGPVFKARVLSDGSVEFGTKREVANILFSLLPSPLPKGTPSLQSSIRDLVGRKRRGAVPDTPTDWQPPGAMSIPRMSPHRPDPSLECTFPRPCFIEWEPMMVSAAGRFDVTDEIVRMMGDDPHSYEKARFLQSTEAFRRAFAAMNRSREVNDGLLALQKRLRSIWGDAHLSRERKRALITQMRAELDLEHDHGRRAAALIDGFLHEVDPDDPAPANQGGVPRP